MIDQSVVVAKFLEWYKSDTHSANEDFYSDTFTFEYLSQLPKEDFIDYFYNFASDGGKVQSGGERTKNKLRVNIQENYEEFRHNVLEIFSGQFDVETWIEWATNFKYLGQGLATIILNRKDKNTYAIVNEKSIEGLTALGYYIKKSGSLYKKYLEISTAERDLMTKYPDLKNYYIIDAMMHFIIGTDEGKAILNDINENSTKDPILFIIQKYKDHIRLHKLSNEVYKWKLLKKFRGRPNLDVSDFVSEIKSIDYNNLVYPMALAVRQRILDNFPKEYQEYLHNLFDETIDITERIKKFMEDIQAVYIKSKGERAHHHDERTISTFLTFYNPDKYTFFKDSFYKEYCKIKGINPKQKGEKYAHYLELVRDFRDKYILPDHELLRLFNESMDADCIEDQHHLLKVQDILYQMLDKKNDEAKDNATVNENINPNKFNAMNKYPLNTILFGPPGTGKTYHTINEAVRIIDPEYYEDNKSKRDALRSFYTDKLIVDWEIAKGQIGFCTFHQSFSYEDFVEGIKPVEPSDGDTYLKYKIEEGIFKRMCRLASDGLRSADIKKTHLISMSDDQYNQAAFYKLSLGDINNPTDQEIYDYCMDQGLIALGFGEGIDFSGMNETQVNTKYSESLKDGYGAQAVNYFKNYLKTGNYVIISKGNHYIRAIGKVTGEYYFDLSSPIRFNHFRKVEWIFKDQEIPVQDFYDRNLSQQTIYKLNSALIKRSFFVKSDSIPDIEKKKSPPKYILVIDEINRGNVASIFGELITLIEPDKRAGNKEALEVVLPYSKQRFTVPPNLYIIGTMNTADRSIEALDTALRRRFSFKEMAPDPELIRNEGSLKGSNGRVNDIDVVELLNSINNRIEKLIDKDHKIGHAYFMDINTIEDLKAVFKDKVIPLLEEYFFGDYGKIGLVLGDSFVEQALGDSFQFATFNSYDGQVTQDLADRSIYRIKAPHAWNFGNIYFK